MTCYNYVYIFCYTELFAKDSTKAIVEELEKVGSIKKISIKNKIITILSPNFDRWNNCPRSSIG